MENDEINRLQIENAALKKEIEVLRGWRENSLRTVKRLAEQVKSYISAWNKSCGEINDLRKEKDYFKELCEDLEIDNDKVEGLYQDEHCDNIKLKQQLAGKEEMIKEYKTVAVQAQNAAIHINQQAEKYEEQIKVLEKDLVDWQDAYKELEEAHDKIQGAYQDDHCDLLKYKENFLKIKEIVHERVNGENIKGWDYFTGITDIWHLLLELQEEEDETKNT